MWAPPRYWLRAGLAALLAAAGCAPEPRGAAERTTSLVRLARELAEPETAAEGAAGLTARALPGGAELATLGLARDHRTAILQPLPNRLRLGPARAGAGCSLRFGFGLDAEAWRAGTPVRLRVAVAGSRGGAQSVFEETVAPRPAADPRWLDRDVALPDAEGPIQVVFETQPAAPGAGPTPGRAAWGAPHIVCPAPVAPPPARPHVVLVSLDTLRADHLSLYGYERETSPVLDAFAREALVFENAFAPSPWTLPSHASMLTGLPPEVHGAGRGAVSRPLADEFRTLAELLAEGGYHTVAFTGAALVTRTRGLAQGFAEWTESFRANLRSVLPEVLEALPPDTRRPTFLFLHTYDVHSPYDHPEAFRVFEPERPSALGLPRDALERRLREREVWRQLAEAPHNRQFELARFRDPAELVAAYDAGIRFVDAQLGVLFEHLRRSGLLRHTLVIVTSDHGESLLDHGPYVGHAYPLTDPVVRVPLVVRMPGGEPRGRSDALVDLVDLAPLVLETAGLAPPEPLPGANPLARLEERAPERAVVYGESMSGAHFARTRRWKLITEAVPERLPEGVHVATEEQIFDLRNDPAERQNLAGSEAARAEVEALRSLLDGIEPPPGAAAGAPALGPSEREQLRALGYLP